MKRILTMLLLLVGSTAIGQTIDKIVDTKIASKADSIGTIIKVLTDRVTIVESKVNSGGSSSTLSNVEYDTTFVFDRTTTNATATSIDTLKGSTNLYQITYGATNQSTGDIGSGQALVSVKYFNGTYTVVRTVNVASWSGQGTLSSCKLAVVKVNNLPVIQITGAAGTIVKWTITKSKLL